MLGLLKVQRSFGHRSVLNEMFKSLDRDGNSLLTETEAMPLIDALQQFKEAFRVDAIACKLIDKNGDKFLTDREIEEYVEPFLILE